jgi:DNA-directed RNA polymerase subunit beta
MKVLDQEGEEIDLKQTYDDDDDVVGIPVQLEEDMVADTMEGFTMEDEEGNPITEQEADDDFAMESEGYADEDEQY